MKDDVERKVNDKGAEGMVGGVGGKNVCVK